MPKIDAVACFANCVRIKGAVNSVKNTTLNIWLKPLQSASFSQIFIVVFLTEFTSPYSLNTPRGWRTSRKCSYILLYLLSSHFHVRNIGQVVSIYNYTYTFPLLNTKFILTAYGSNFAEVSRKTRVRRMYSFRCLLTIQWKTLEFANIHGVLSSVLHLNRNNIHEKTGR